MKNSRVKVTNTFNVETTKYLEPLTTYSAPGKENANPQAFTSLDKS